MRMTTALALPSTIHAIYYRHGPHFRAFDSIDEALYWLWLLQRSRTGKAVGIWDGRTIYGCVNQNIDGYARELLGLPWDHVFDSRGAIETGYYWDESERGDAKRFCQGVMPIV